MSRNEQMARQRASFTFKGSLSRYALLFRALGLSPPVTYVIDILNRRYQAAQGFRCLHSKTLLDSAIAQSTSDGRRSRAPGPASMSANPSTQTAPLLLREDGANAMNSGVLQSAETALGTYAEPTLREIESHVVGKQKRQPSLAVIACRQW